MKKLTQVMILVGLLISANGCGILKNKHIEKSLNTERIENDVVSSKLGVDSNKSNVVTSKTTNNTISTEEINIKRPISHNIEISANFRMDTSATLKGDTIKLVDVKNNDVSLSIYQNGRTKELMAKVTTSAGSKETPFSEINIKRQYSNNQSKVDSLATFENHSEIKQDSTDKSIIYKEQKNSTMDKQKKAKPSFWIWTVGIIVCAGLIYLVIKK